MRPDVIDLRDFYAGRLGATARQLLRVQIRRIWPDMHGQRLLGLGYATPYLTQFREEAERVIAFMPAAQGVIRWPADDPGNLVALTEETELPLADASVDRVLLVHGLENAENAGALLREIWRVLSGSGRLLVVTPGRTGLWARTERTPFGHGLPYSQGQLNRLLRDHLFQPTERAGALYLPPVSLRMLLSAAGAWEKLGLAWWPAFAGVILAEADKQIYAARPLHARRRRTLGPIPLKPVRRLPGPEPLRARRRAG